MTYYHNKNNTYLIEITDGLTKQSVEKSPKSIISVSSSLFCFFFNVWNVVILIQHIDIAYIAGSKQHIDNTSCKAASYRDTSLMVTGTSLKLYCI